MKLIKTTIKCVLVITVAIIAFLIMCKVFYATNEQLKKELNGRNKETILFIPMNAEQATINNYLQRHDVDLIQIVDRDIKTGIWVSGGIEEFKQ